MLCLTLTMQGTQEPEPQSFKTPLGDSGRKSQDYVFIAVHPAPLPTPQSKSKQPLSESSMLNQEARFYKPA